MTRDERNLDPRGAPERDAPAGRDAAPGTVHPPRPDPEPEEAPELLGERSDYPLSRGGE
jgi:hypothetical protein